MSQQFPPSKPQPSRSGRGYDFGRGGVKFT